MAGCLSWTCLNKHVITKLEHIWRTEGTFKISMKCKNAKSFKPLQMEIFACHSMGRYLCHKYPSCDTVYHGTWVPSFWYKFARHLASRCWNHWLLSWQAALLGSWTPLVMHWYDSVVNPALNYLWLSEEFQNYFCCVVSSYWKQLDFVEKSVPLRSCKSFSKLLYPSPIHPSFFCFELTVLHHHHCEEGFKFRTSSVFSHFFWKQPPHLGNWMLKCPPPLP